mmetsp:Transcript_32320/g.73848  ORF Transcript_32320/g.73848 Transcript_32320/m.73848 type:complete len:110 (-) Transcript_32320:341-670(-)
MSDQQQPEEPKSGGIEMPKMEMPEMPKLPSWMGGPPEEGKEGEAGAAPAFPSVAMPAMPSWMGGKPAEGEEVKEAEGGMKMPEMPDMKEVLGCCGGDSRSKDAPEEKRS